MPFLLRSFRLLISYHPGKYVLLLVLTLLLGFSQGLSVILLIPLLQLLEVDASESSDRIARFLQELTENSGITLTLEVVLVSFAIVLSLTALLGYYKSLLQASYQQGFIFHLRKKLFRKIILSDWQMLNSTSKVNHLQVLTEEIPKMADYYFFFMRLINTLIIVAAYLFFAFIMSVKYSLFVLGVGLFTFFILRRFLLHSHRYGNEHVEAYNRLLKYIDDFWQTVKIAKVHHSERFYYRKFNEANRSILNLDYRILKNYSLPQLISRLAGLLVLIAVIYTGHRIEQVPLVSFFILIILFARIFPLFVSLNTDLNEIASQMGAVRLVLQLDDQLPERDFERQDLSMIEKLEEGISISDLSFSYPLSEMLFRDFSASIPAGKITAIVGPSGKGKTTLIDLIAGLQKARDGKILIDGKPLDEALLPAWKNSLGYLPQDAFFVDGTIRENLVWDSPVNFSDDEIMQILKSVNAADLVTRQEKGLDTIVVNHQYFFSGGERQRLALARILLRKPQVLILDEATSSLDADNERIIMEVLASLKGHVTILFVTHRTSILPWCDHTLSI